MQFVSISIYLMYLYTEFLGFQCEIVIYNGYQCEEFKHQVETDDGFLLTLHRFVMVSIHTHFLISTTAYVS